MVESLAVKNPDVSMQWHPTKNGDLTPHDVTTGSGKKVWWQCEKGHEWEATVDKRSHGRGCPYCAGKRASIENCLKTISPDLSKQWHPNKNGSLTPDGITMGSRKKVWWACEKGHEWESLISNRLKGQGCPYCSGRYADGDNSLQILNPELAREWHPIKNGALIPSDVKSFSNAKVWWVCNRGHEWKSAVAKRSDGQRCPYCSGQRVCIDNCLQTLNSDLAKQWHPTKMQI